MTTGTLTEHPARKAEVEAWLDERGVTWTFEPELPLDQVDVKASLANQARHEPLDPDVVDLYTDDVKRGDVFPAVLAHDRGPRKLKVLLGGNHRHHAHIGAGATTEPAYLLTGVDPELTVRLAYEDNRKHGKPPTLDERIAQAIHLVDNGWTQDAAGAMVGVKGSQISVAIAMKANSRRAADLGIGPQFDALAKGHRATLGRLRSDPVFTEAVRTVSRFGLGQVDTNELYRQVNDARSDKDAVAIIGMKAGEIEDRVRSAARGKGEGPTERAKLQRALTAIKALSPAAVEASTPNRDVAKFVRSEIEATKSRLDECLKALR